MSGLDKSLSDIIKTKDKKSRSNRRYNPYNRNQNRNRNNNNNNGNYVNFDYEGEMLKVSHQSNPKSVAGKLNSIVRNGDPPQICMIGPGSCNQAVKAVAISRRNLQQDRLDLLVHPRFQRAPGTGPERDSFIFAVRKGPKRKNLPSTTDMKVASASDAGVVAGAISKKLRAGERLSLQAIGANSVNQAVKSIVIARKYMIDDGMDIGFRPEFTKFQVGDGEYYGLKLILFASQS